VIPVAAGVGVSVLPERVVDRWAPGFPVAVTEGGDGWAHRRLTICHNRSANLSAPAKRLLPASRRAVTTQRRRAAGTSAVAKQETGGASAQRAEDVVVLLEGGEGHDLDART
jgi:hypothetical protein